jgi:hypothetical protein
MYLRIYRIFCSVHVEITSIRLRKGVYNLIEVISNEPVNIWDTWKTLNYLNINENRKDVYPCKFIVLLLLIVVFFGFLNIKCKYVWCVITGGRDINFMMFRFFTISMYISNPILLPFVFVCIALSTFQS